MNVRFDSLEIQDFLSFGYVDLDFPHGLVLVDGLCEGNESTDSNGAGKTGIIEAILWCLFCKTLRGYKADEVINNKVVKGKTKVVLHLTCDDEELIVKRHRKHKKYKDELHVSYGGKDISGPSAQAQLEKILGISFRTFTNSMVFGQDLILFGRMTDAERKKLLDEILDLEVLEEARKHTKKLMRDIDVELSEINLSIAVAEQSLEDMLTNIKDYKTRSQVYEAEKKRALVDRVSELEGHRKDLLFSNVSQQLYHIASTQAEVLYLSLEQQVAALEEEAEGVLEPLREAERELSEELHEKKRVKTALKQEIAIIAALSPGTECPTCRQTLNKSHQRNVLSKLRLTGVTLSSDIKVLEVTYVKTFSSLDVVDGEYKVRINDYRDRLEEVDKQHSRVQTLFESGEGQVVYIHKAIADAEARLVSKSREKDPYSRLIAKAERRVSGLEADHVKLNKQKTGLAKQLKSLKFWEWGFGQGGLKSYILDSLTPLLNDIANGYASALTGGNLRVEFYTKEKLKSRKGEFTEKFGFVVHNPKGAVDYMGSSAGEKRRIDLIILLSLQALVESVSDFTSNIAFYDEVFDHLDYTGRELMLEVLRSEASKRETIFVITQESSLRDYFSVVITVKKDANGISTITR